MNKRIQELANQAGLYVDVNGEPWPKWLGAEQAHEANEKFAKLIVKECSTIIEAHGRFLRYDLLNKKVKDHFG